ncbi:MAG: nucleoside hydrolase [Kiritimatiellales bacterium]|nr:nucleoside hydrolase [Kiritimatiellales bacterium]
MMGDMMKKLIEAGLVGALVATVGCATTNTGKIRVLVDSDANNETDDQHAIAYALLSDDVFNVEGITVNKTRSGGNADEQMKEAVRVAKLCGACPGVPIHKGANGSFEEILPHIGEPDFDGHEAVDFIIRQAKKPSTQKLVLIPIGKLTNIALALAKEPSIIPKVRVVWLGSNYPKPGEYNQDNDLSSVRYLMDCPVEFEMVTVRYGNPSGTWGIKAYQQDIFDKMPGKGPRSAEPVTGRHGGTFHTFGDYSVSLYKHAKQHGNPPFRSFFDVGAVAVVKDPTWADAVVVPRPQLNGKKWVDRPDNALKMVVWENFDSEAIMADFFQTMDNGIK